MRFHLPAIVVLLLLVSGCAARLASWPGAIAPQADIAPAWFATPRPPFAAPARDPFHAQPSPAELAVTPPGTVMRYRAIEPRAYYLFDVRAWAWQLVYRTRDGHGTAQTDVATVLVPPGFNSARLVSYQVAYDALTTRCAPSREILSGALVEQRLIDQALHRGWIVVLPDYEGPHAEFLAGPNAAHGVLDGIRAARAFLGAARVDPEAPVALWGYSGGAFASLWAAQRAASYAPDIRLAGVAAGGPPANLAASAAHIDGGLFAGLYFAGLIGLSRAHPELDIQALLNAKGREMFADLNSSCVAQELAWVKDPLLSGYSFDEMSDYVTVDDLLAVPAIRRALDANSLGGHGFDAPLFYYQAWFDPLTPRADARGLARRYCDRSVRVRFDWVPGEHISAAVTHADNAAAWLAARFAGEPAPNDCPVLTAPSRSAAP